MKNIKKIALLSFVACTITTQVQAAAVPPVRQEEIAAEYGSVLNVSEYLNILKTVIIAIVHGDGALAGASIDCLQRSPLSVYFSIDRSGTDIDRQAIIDLRRNISASTEQREKKFFKFLTKNVGKQLTRREVEIMLNSYENFVTGIERVEAQILEAKLKAAPKARR